MFKTINTLYTHYRLFGKGGLQFLFQKRIYKNAIISIKLKNYSHPIFLRNNTSDIPMFYHIFSNKEYEIDFPFSPNVIMDFGAHVGLSAVYFTHRFPQAKIYCVEPEASNFEMLKKNIQYHSNIQCLHAGVWSHTTDLKIVDAALGNWGFMTEEVDEAGIDSIKAFSVDDLMNIFNVGSIDICKINIEGTEKELFEKNYQNWLPKTKAIIIELHDNMREGCSASFFKAMNHYKYSLSQSWSYLVCMLKN